MFDMNICTGWSPPCTSSRRSIINYDRTYISLGQGFLRQPHLAALISAEEKAKYISVNWIKFLYIIQS